MTVSVIETISNVQNVPDTTYDNTEANVTSSILLTFEEYLSQTEGNFNYTTENVQVITTNVKNMNTGLGIASIILLDHGGKAYQSLRNDDLLLLHERKEIPIGEANVAMWIPKEFAQGAERGRKSLYVQFQWEKWVSWTSQKQKAI